MVNLLPGENPDEEGYLLHELQNASPPADFETEQRDRNFPHPKIILCRIFDFKNVFFLHQYANMQHISPIFAR